MAGLAECLIDRCFSAQRPRSAARFSSLWRYRGRLGCRTLHAWTSSRRRRPRRQDRSCSRGRPASSGWSCSRAIWSGPTAPSTRSCGRATTARRRRACEPRWRAWSTRRAASTTGCWRSAATWRCPASGSSQPPPRARRIGHGDRPLGRVGVVHAATHGGARDQRRGHAADAGAGGAVHGARQPAALRVRLDGVRRGRRDRHLRRGRPRRRAGLSQHVRAHEVGGRGTRARARRAAAGADLPPEHRRRRAGDRLDSGLQRDLCTAARVREGRLGAADPGPALGAGRRRAGRLRRRRDLCAVQPRGRRGRDVQPRGRPAGEQRRRAGDAVGADVRALAPADRAPGPVPAHDPPACAAAQRRRTAQAGCGRRRSSSPTSRCVSATTPLARKRRWRRMGSVPPPLATYFDRLVDFAEAARWGRRTLSRVDAAGAVRRRAASAAPPAPLRGAEALRTG